MRKLSLLLIIVLVVAFTTGVFAQRLAIIKPTTPGHPSDVIPIDNKIYQKLLKNEITDNDLKVLESTHMGIVDTIGYSTTSNTNLGFQCNGDTALSYYEPSAACYIKAVGVIGQLWGTANPIADGFNLLINKSAHPWDWPDSKWQGDGFYPEDSLGYATLLGPEMWGSGGFPVTVVGGTRVWTEMIFLGFEPDNQKEGFIITVVPYGATTTNYMGTDCESYTGTDDHQRIAKFYQAGRGAHGPQYVIRNYRFTWRIVVEFYENTAPVAELEGAYGSVLNADARTITIHVTDLDANDATKAGVGKGEMYYSINGGTEQKVTLTLASGTVADGMWNGVLPAGYIKPGEVCTFRFEVSDIPGLKTELDGGSFGYFVKKENILFYYNDVSLTIANAKGFYWNDAPGFKFDTWDGATDGATQAMLLDMYDYIVRVDGAAPYNQDSAPFQAWLASGTTAKKKHLLWSSMEFLGGDTSPTYTNGPYAADDWHYKYLGLAYLYNDVQNAATGANPPRATWRVDAVKDDIITGAMAKFVSDNKYRLLINAYYELGASDWSDNVDPTPTAVTCFTDSTTGKAMGVHQDGATTKTVFLTFDPLTLDINPPYGTAGYNWPEYGDPVTGAPLGLSVIRHSLKWFGLVSAVDEGTNTGLALGYDLQQNYPNPFNPETKITYSISKPGHVNLSVYNALGQKVAELVNGTKAAAKYQVTWNANNLSSGVYFYRLEAGDFTRTMKMMLLH